MPSVATAKGRAIDDWLDWLDIAPRHCEERGDEAIQNCRRAYRRTVMKTLFASLALAMAATSALAQTPAAPGTRTIVNDRTALNRLRRNSGITLQWLSFESAQRGHVVAQMNGGLLHLNGAQNARGGPGRVTLDGDVLQINPRSFSFRGRIVITDAPDRGRNCVRDGIYEFRVATGLQNFEACDGLADYVDIYF